MQLKIKGNPELIVIFIYINVYFHFTVLCLQCFDIYFNISVGCLLVYLQCFGIYLIFIFDIFLPKMLYIACCSVLTSLSYYCLLYSTVYCI